MSVSSQVERRLHEQVRQQVETRRNGLGALEDRLRLLGPEQVLARGYSITADAATGRVLREAREVRAGQRLKTRLKAGEVFSRAGGVSEKCLSCTVVMPTAVSQLHTGRARDLS